jgi:hypothetical protein
MYKPCRFTLPFSWTTHPRVSPCWIIPPRVPPRRGSPRVPPSWIIPPNWIIPPRVPPSRSVPPRWTLHILNLDRETGRPSSPKTVPSNHIFPCPKTATSTPESPSPSPGGSQKRGCTDALLRILILVR